MPVNPASAPAAAYRIAIAPDELLATRTDGSVAAIDAGSGRDEGVVATGTLPSGGIAEAPDLSAVLVTRNGEGGCPSIWRIPLGPSGSTTELLTRAELPTLSPDGRFLGVVTLDARCHQNGIGLVAVGAGAALAGPIRKFPTVEGVPPPRIGGLAVAPRATTVAVWGGVVDPYLGADQATVSILDPSTATSLSQAAPLADGRGASVVPGGGPASVLTNDSTASTSPAPRWQFAAPAYSPDGSLVVGGGDEVSVYWSTPTSLTIATLVKGSEAVRAVAFGPDFQLAAVDKHGTLEVAPSGAKLPISGFDGTRTVSMFRTLGAGYAAVTWTPGQAAASATPRPTYTPVASLPRFVGMPESKASAELSALLLPVLVEHEASATVPVGDVIRQDPAPGTGMMCECTVVLVVSVGP